VIRIDSLWLAVEPMDMRAGAERLLTSVVQVFGRAQAHHGYLFANARTTRIKLLVHDGFGVWCAARRLNAGRFVWPRKMGTGADGLDAAAIRRTGAGPAVAADHANAGHHADVIAGRN
jgi:transposase